MSRIERTDIHRPSAIIPSDYQFVAVEFIKLEGTNLGDASFIIAERLRIQQHMERTGGTYAAHEHGGNCMICGAWAIYTMLFYHEKTNSYIRTGQDCAQKLEMSADHGAMNKFRAQVREALAAHAGKRKALALLQLHGIEAAWDVQYSPVDGQGMSDEEFRKAWARNPQREERIIRDIVERLIKYGSISEKQVNYTRKLLQAISSREERLYAQALEENHVRDTAAPWVAGRQDVSGNIVSARFVDYEYAQMAHIQPTALKILLKRDDGAKLWVSLPSRMWTASDVVEQVRGARIEGLRVTVKLSDKDPIFAFGSRPSGGVLTLKGAA